MVFMKIKIKKNLTTELNPNDIEDLIIMLKSQFIKQLQKLFDIRITVIGDKVFSYAIYSQNFDKVRWIESLDLSEKFNET